MKKNAFLAVGVLSLGLAGFGAVAPIATAAVTDTATATITVTVPEFIGITSKGDVSIANAGANKISTGNHVLSTQNNTGKSGTVTVKTSAASNAMTGEGAAASKTIPAMAQAGALNANTAGWGIQTSADNYAPVPASGASAGYSVGNDGGATTKDFTVTYGVATGLATAGTYKAEVTYSFTVN